jgi:hypothetical protein
VKIKKTPLILKTSEKVLPTKKDNSLGLDKYEYSFEVIANSSINGTGCNQIKNYLENLTSSDYNLWLYNLSIAYRCVNGPELAHKLSSAYSTYDEQKTEAQLQSLEGFGTECKTFEKDFPEGCKGCSHKGTIKNPIALGKRLRVAQPRSDDSTDAAEPEEVQVDSEYPAEYIQFPQSLFPFVRAAGGGIYYQPPPKTQKDGTQTARPPIGVVALRSCTTKETAQSLRR